MTTEEGNKFIAVFDDLVLQTDDSEYTEVWYHKDDNFKINRITELKYHSSWDWLMPVVEKIQEVPANDYLVAVQKNKVVLLQIYCPIGMVWNQVVYFINWLNEYTKNNSQRITFLDGIEE